MGKSCLFSETEMSLYGIFSVTFDAIAYRALVRG